MTLKDADRQILSFLDERWKKPLDITTIGQAQQALGHPADDDERWHISEHLDTNPGRLADKVRYGVSATTVTLTNEEKLAGRALLLGRSEEESREAAGIDLLEWDTAKLALRRIGLLAGDSWQSAAGHERLLGGVGLLFHTVRTGGEVFNVP